jgi:hypothetical protein
MSSKQTDLPSWYHLSVLEREFAVPLVHLQNAVIHSLHAVSWIHNEPRNLGNKKILMQ